MNAEPPRRPTMVDVARLARVAVSTVSRVANADSTVGPALAERVRRAIDELGWEADERARHLRTGVSGTIGAVVGDLDSPFLRGAERAARTAGLMLLAASTDLDEALEAKAISSLCRRRVDGLIIEPGAAGTGAYLRAQIAHGLPVVAIDRPIPDTPSDSVVVDNAHGIDLAYDRLLARGHRYIAHVGDTEVLSTARDRADAFRRRLRVTEPHRAPAQRVFTGPVTTERVALALEAALAVRPAPTALVTGNAATSTCAFRVLGAELGGLDLVGFDDFELAVVSDPPWTVVAQDFATMGAAALEMIRTRIQSPGLPLRQQVVPVRLVERTRAEPLRSVGRVVPRALQVSRGG